MQRKSYPTYVLLLRGPDGDALASHQDGYRMQRERIIDYYFYLRGLMDALASHQATKLSGGVNALST